MGISRKDLEKHRDFFHTIFKSKKKLQVDEIVSKAKFVELKALQGLVNSVLDFEIPISSSQKHRLKPQRIPLRTFALTRCTTKGALLSSLRPVVHNLRTFVKPLFPKCTYPSENVMTEGDVDSEQQHDQADSAPLDDPICVIHDVSNSQSVVESSPSSDPAPAPVPVVPVVDDSSDSAHSVSMSSDSTPSSPKTECADSESD
jgi:hypothetical protein